jgi:hypothetical protein
VAVAAIVVVLIGSAVAWAVVRAQPGPAESAAPEIAASTAATTAPARRGPTAPPMSTQTATAADPALARARSALSACADSIAVRERLAQAAAASARDWRTHIEAQLKLDRGAWTIPQAKAAWAASKARGPADVRQFAAAAAAVRTSNSTRACRSVVADTASTGLASNGTRCAARDRALAAVSTTGEVVNAQWAAHLTMMADKPHTDSDAYHARWMTMVAESQAPLERYAAAAAALARAPTCSP